MRVGKGIVALTLLTACCSWPVQAAVTVGQADTFADGTTLGWATGHTGAFSPANVATGGPAGAGDNYLQLTATGIPGPGGRLSAINTGQWTGDFVGAGVGSISMDVNNFGPDPLALRLLFADPKGGPPADIATTNANLVPAGSGWQTVTFAVDPASLTTILGSANAAITGATEMRIFHNPDPTFPGPPGGIPHVHAQLGVDNIRAIAGTAPIPEPATLTLLGVGLLPLLRRRKAA